MPTEKLKYEVDPNNRLIIRETGPEPRGVRGRKSELTYFRRVLDGTFKTGPNNTLIYTLKTVKICVFSVIFTVLLIRA